MFFSFFDVVMHFLSQILSLHQCPRSRIDWDSPVSCEDDANLQTRIRREECLEASKIFSLISNTGPIVNTKFRYGV